MTGTVDNIQPGDIIIVNRGGHKFFATMSQVGNAPSSSVHARVHFDNTTSLAIASIGVPLPIASAVTVNGTTRTCTINTSLATITYDGTVARLCNISAVMALQPATGSVRLTLNIEINGSVVASSNNNLSTLKRWAEVEITTELQPGDVVRLSAQNDTDTANIDADAFVGMNGLSGAVDPTRGFLVVAGA